MLKVCKNCLDKSDCWTDRGGIITGSPAETILKVSIVMMLSGVRNIEQASEERRVADPLSASFEV